MVVNIQKLKANLLEIYEGYSKDVSDKSISKKAQDLFFEYVYNADSLDRDLVRAVQGLEHIGWEYSRSTRKEQNWKMGAEEANEIFGKLKEIK
jgi:hypothetical protein